MLTRILFLTFLLTGLTMLPVPAVRAQNQDAIRYAAMGDSYTIGTGTTPENSWPSLLVSHLQSEGVNIQLIANPSKAGYSTQQAILYELPVFLESNPNFATLMIGVNDWVRGVSAEQFQKNFVYLLDRMRQVVRNDRRIIVINIPDFSYTPNGRQVANGRDITQGIAAFNSIIQEESHKRGITVVDLFKTSKSFGMNKQNFSGDGLHPSREGYLFWEELIYPYVKSILVNHP